MDESKLKATLAEKNINLLGVTPIAPSVWEVSYEYMWEPTFGKPKWTRTIKFHYADELDLPFIINDVIAEAEAIRAELV